jgi:hypothetical protein
MLGRTTHVGFVPNFTTMTAAFVSLGLWERLPRYGTNGGVGHGGTLLLDFLISVDRREFVNTDVVFALVVQ